MYFDIFNGDADGILALHQFRLHNPQPEATLVTGVKRDIKLLSKIQEMRDSSITVFDISLDSNRDALLSLLDQNNDITYFDHHFAGDLPETKRLTAHIDPSPAICTSLIVDQLLGGKYKAWAVAAAFGDNLHDSAQEAARGLALSAEQLSGLREIGELLNYNGYGADISDLHFSPDALYRALHPYEDPFSFLMESPDLATLRQGFEEDMALAMEQKEMDPGKRNRIYTFPNTPWARRVAGVFSNLRAREKKDAAHALIVENDDTTLRISVRAPLNDKKNADSLCLSFPTGGGRKAAAGINNLPADMLEAFLDRFESIFSA
ncbi:MAG: DHH family phosphoesterase [Thermodesulfobacteriota bacterium]|nr:DHH family phosphoesterase [Thermodesulfobacteriota bacterium]